MINYLYLFGFSPGHIWVYSLGLALFLIVSICLVQPSPSPLLPTPWCALLWLSSVSLHLHFIKASDLIFITQLHVNREPKDKVQARSWPSCCLDNLDRVWWAPHGVAMELNDGDQESQTLSKATNCPEALGREQGLRCSLSSSTGSSDKETSVEPPASGGVPVQAP